MILLRLGWLNISVDGKLSLSLLDNKFVKDMVCVDCMLSDENVCFVLILWLLF